MSHSPYPGKGRGGDGFRPWKRSSDGPEAPSGNRSPFSRGPRSFGHDDRDGFRPFKKRFGDDAPRPAWRDRDDDRGPRSFGHGGDRDGFRPFKKRFDDDDRGPRSFGHGDDRDGFRPFKKRFGDDDRGPRPFKKRFGDRPDFDRRPPWKHDDEEAPAAPSWRKDADLEDDVPEFEDARQDADTAAPAFDGEDAPAFDAGRTAEDLADDESEEAPAPRPSAAKNTDPPEAEPIYGRQPVREMLRSNRRVVHKLILADGVKASEEVTEIAALANERAVPVERYPRATLDNWLNKANHQGIVAVCADYPYAEFDEVYDAFLAKEGDALLILLDHVVDPQNLGSLLRTAETAGAVGVVVPVDRAVGVTPAAVRASAGASEHLRIAQVASLPDAILKLKEAKVGDEPVFVNVTGLEGTPESTLYTDIDFTGKTALVVGSEGLGLGKLVSERCDHLAKLPMFGKVSSLNAGVAGAIAIYEVLRQQSARK